MGQTITIEDGLLFVQMGLENSTEACGFLSTVGQLVSYEGPDTPSIGFRMTSNSVKQAYEWGLDIVDILTTLQKFMTLDFDTRTEQLLLILFSGNRKQANREYKYGRWYSGKEHPFWTKLRMVQTLWLLRYHSGLINPGNLPFSMKVAMSKDKIRWHELVMFAGFNPVDEAVSFTREYWDKQKILLRLQERKRNGLGLYNAELARSDKPLLAAMQNHFGSWRAAVEAAGFDPEQEWKGRRRRLTKEQLVREIIAKRSNGDTLTQQAVFRTNRDLFYSAIDHFGGWYQALGSIGINPEDITYKSWSRAKILEEIRDIHERGESLRRTAIERHHPPLSGAIRRVYEENWDDAIRDAGFDPQKIRRGSPRNPTWVIQELQRMKREGEPINTHYLSRFNSPLENAARKFFGSWTQAVIAAGFNPEQESPRPHLLRIRREKKERN